MDRGRREGSSQPSSEPDLPGVALPTTKCSFFPFFKILFYLFLERERKGEREGEKHPCTRDNIDQLPLTRPQLGSWPASQACALTGDRTSNLLVHRPHSIH